MSEFVKIGHRGAAGHEPENTMRSFVTAIKLGANAIEIDVRLSADGKIIVIHDATVDRTTNGRGLVSNFTYDELRRLDAGKGEKIPTLEQVFGVLGKGNAFGWKPFFHIELKEAGMTEKVLLLIRQYHLVDSVVVSTFDMNENQAGDTSVWNDLFILKRSEPDLRIALLAKRDENFRLALGVIYRSGLQIYAVNPAKNNLTTLMIDETHKRGAKVLVWTVNNSDEIARIKAMGVDGIFSDYPDRL